MIDYLVVFGVACSTLGCASYIRDTLHGRVKPNRVTFALWALAPLIASAAAFADGVRWAAVPVLFSGLLPLAILIASFVNPAAKWQTKPFDYGCAALSLLALVLWAITRDPAVAVLFAVLADTLAAVPTIRKAWTNPETEAPAVYLASLVSAATSFFAEEDHGFTSLAFPIYLILCNSIVLLALMRHRLPLRHF